jgi:hypothetical protein
MSTRLGWGLWGLLAISSVGLAIYSYRYFLPLDLRGPPILGNAYSTPFLYIHIVGAATALLTGPLNFVAGVRAPWPNLNRWVGRIYVTGCLLGGVGGLVAAFGSTAGPIVAAGFGLLAVCWIMANVQGWRMARARRFAEHRKWMIRSFAMSLAAVTLRLYMALLPILHFPVLEGYRAISFLCWIPNLIVADFYIRGTSGMVCGAGRRKE